MSIGVRQPRPDTREKTKSALNPHVLFSNTLCEVGGVYKLPKNMTPVELKIFMAANGKTEVSNHPDLTGHERGAKADRAGQTRTHNFDDHTRDQYEILRRMKEMGFR